MNLIVFITNIMVEDILDDNDEEFLESWRREFLDSLEMESLWRKKLNVKRQFYDPT
jgi:hypothetical protein